MSESGRAQSGSDGRHWRKACFGLSAAGIVAVCTVALSGQPVPAAVAASVLLLGLALYVAAPRSADAAGVARVPLQGDRAALPDAARDVLECLDDPLLILDGAGRVIFANRPAHIVVGTDSEKKHISAVLRTPPVLEAVDRVLHCGNPETATFSFPVPVLRYYQAYVARVGTSRTPGASVLVQVRDLTALRKAEELRADFVANASHELRTPLAAVSGFIDTLRGHAKDDAEARERFLEIMSVEAGRMRRLIEDLLSLTRIELNEHNPPDTKVDLVGIVRDATNALSPLAESDDVKVEIAPHESLAAIGDRDELIQVFQNLIHNGIKYGRHGGTLRIEFGRLDAAGKRDGTGQVFVSVHDEGEGIPREAIPRLTERFYRVDVRRSRERGGTGLGLAIVKHILNRHHGRLQVESTPGTGSTFTVFLPASITQGDSPAVRS